MRHLKKGRKLGVTASHKRAMLSNMAASLIQHESIRTTCTRAKALRPYVERLITRGKKGDLHSRRQVLRFVKDEEVVSKLFTEIAERFTTREGGYTRIIRLGLRAGDGAEMALIQLMGAAVVGAKSEVKGEAKGEKKSGKKGKDKSGEKVDKGSAEKAKDRIGEKADKGSVEKAKVESKGESVKSESVKSESVKSESAKSEEEEAEKTD